MFSYKELSRAIFNWRFAIPVIAAWVLMFWGMSLYYPLDPTPPPEFHPLYFNAYVAWRYAVNVLVLFAPLAATLPYADSYLRDRTGGFARYTLLRTSHRHYLISKFIVNGLVGGLAVALPMLLFFGYTFSVYARALPPPSSSPPPAVGFLHEIYLSSPNLYILGRIILGFFFGATFSTLGMAVSPFVRTRYVVLAFPLVFFWAFGFLANFLGIPVWWPAYVLAPDGILDSNVLTVLLPIIILCTLSTISIFGFIRKYNDYQLY